MECSFCNAREIGDASHLHGDCVYSKGVQLQLLIYPTEQLELRMDSLWSIHEAENVVDSTFTELVTPPVKAAQIKDHRRGSRGLENSQHCSFLFKKVNRDNPGNYRP
eukprot:g27689.t1